MKYLVALIALLAFPAHSEDGPIFAKKQDLLKLGAPTKTYSDRKFVLEEMNRGYHLAVEGGSVRVWDTNSKGFPGYQPPVIQVLDEKGSVLASKEMSDPCWMLNGRIHRMRHTQRIFVYIECRYRQWATAPGTHIFEITEGPAIKEGGIFWSENDLKLGAEEASKEALRRSEWNADGLKVKRIELDGSTHRKEPPANPVFLQETSTTTNKSVPN